MKKIAIIGTGIMGSGMAANFLKHSYPVVVWNRTAKNAASLVGLGAHLAATPRSAAEGADLVFDVTPNDESSRSVWLGDKGILAGARPGSTLIASGTFSVNWIDELARLCQKQERYFFDMPLTGSRAGAESGTLTLLVGGDEKKLTELRETLSAISQKISYFGPAGSGTRFKLLLNMLQAIHIVGLGEVLELAKRSGLDLHMVGDALAEKPGGTATALAWQAFQNPPAQTNFAVQWIEKDLEYAKAFAEGLTTPLLDDAVAKYMQAIEEGKGDEDWTVVMRKK